MGRAELRGRLDRHTAESEPDCSPGFTCLHGACVTACNPGCAGGEQCGGDRSCHAKQ